MGRRQKSDSERIKDAIKRCQDPKSFKQDGNDLICVTCCHKINFVKNTITTRIKAHIESISHQKTKLETKNVLITESIKKQKDIVSLKDQFESELLEMMLQSGIALNKLRNESFKKFLNNWTNQKIPSVNTMRRRVEDKKDEVVERIKRTVSDNRVYFIVDESTDKEGRCVVNVLVGILDGQPNKAMLLKVDFVTRVDNESIVKVIQDSCAILWGEKQCYDKLHVLISDQARYMIKTGRVLKSNKLMFPNIRHITCLSHAIHLVCNAIRKQFKDLDKVFSLEKKVFFNSNQRRRNFMSRTKLKMIPHPIITRWGSWLTCVKYHCEADNYDKIKSYFINADYNNDSLDKLKKKLVNPKIEEQLAASNKFVGLIDIIAKLQNESQSKDQQLRLLSDAQNMISGSAFKDVLDKSLAKNPDFKYLTESTSLRDRIDLDYLPLTSSAVERSFSIYNSFLTDDRLSFKPVNISHNMIVKYNNFL